MEKTLILLKPDALQRNFLGEVISRFERKGLKIVGLKMMRLSEKTLEKHYSQHKGKEFFKDLVKFMKDSPVVAIVLEGRGAIKAVRNLCGPTVGREAEAGTIRGDFSMSHQHNIVHASDSLKTAKKEINRFFNDSELFDYEKYDMASIYADDELKD